VQGQGRKQGREVGAKTLVAEKQHVSVQGTAMHGDNKTVGSVGVTTTACCWQVLAPQTAAAAAAAPSSSQVLTADGS
jgi:hypothetical protein